METIFYIEPYVLNNNDHQLEIYGFSNRLIINRNNVMDVIIVQKDST